MAIGNETLGGVRPLSIVADHEESSLDLGFTNGSGAALVEGQEVYIKSDGNVAKRTTGTQVPLGIVKVGAADGARVVVRTNFMARVECVAGSGGLTTGGEAIPTGVVDGNGRYTYIAPSSGDFVAGLVCAGGSATATCYVGLLRAPYKK